MSPASEKVIPIRSKTKKAPRKTKKKKLPEILINGQFCKGCGICVAFCPKQVLEMKDGKAHVANLKDCISCLFCELRCPDFAISVVLAKE